MASALAHEPQNRVRMRLLRTLHMLHLRTIVPYILQRPFKQPRPQERSYATTPNPGFIDYKAAINLVTDAGSTGRRTDCSHNSFGLPSHRILAEERGQDGSTDSPYRWIIDPLDGTTNFAHGFPFYSVSIGWIQRRIHSRVVLDPVRGELFTGIAGQGPI